MSPRTVYTGVFFGAVLNGSFYISTYLEVSSGYEFLTIRESLSSRQVKH